MKIHLIALLYIIFVVMGCEDRRAADKADPTIAKLTAKDLNTKESVVNFVNENKQRSIEEVKAMLWEPRSEYIRDNIISIWYTVDDIPFRELDRTEEKLQLGGFTLRFKDNKLIKADYDYR